MVCTECTGRIKAHGSGSFRAWRPCLRHRLSQLQHCMLRRRYLMLYWAPGVSPQITVCNRFAATLFWLLVGQLPLIQNCYTTFWLCRFFCIIGSVIMLESEIFSRMLNYLGLKLFVSLMHLKCNHRQTCMSKLHYMSSYCITACRNGSAANGYGLWVWSACAAYLAVDWMWLNWLMMIWIILLTSIWELYFSAACTCTMLQFEHFCFKM